MVEERSKNVMLTFLFMNRFVWFQPFWILINFLWKVFLNCRRLIAFTFFKIFSTKTFTIQTLFLFSTCDSLPEETLKFFFSFFSKKCSQRWQFPKVPLNTLPDQIWIRLPTGSRSTFEFPSRVNLSGPRLYCIARTLGK